MIVPRGGKGLVARVQAEARVPVFAHLEGVVHVYRRQGRRPRDGEDDRAERQDAPHRRVRRRRDTAGRSRGRRNDLKPLVAMLLDARLRSARRRRCAQRSTRASNRRAKTTGGTEYLDAIIAAKVVDGVDAAIAHIERYGSHHTDAIITADQKAAREIPRTKSTPAIVLHNASTQFADGGEFGFGAEIGIATGRMHARGPVGVEQLCTFKYRVRGTGQTAAVSSQPGADSQPEASLPPHAPRSEDRPVRRHVRSAARRASRRHACWR